MRRILMTGGALGALAIALYGIWPAAVPEAPTSAVAGSEPARIPAKNTGRPAASGESDAPSLQLRQLDALHKGAMALSTPEGRLLMAPQQKSNEKVPANIPDLDAVLDDDDANDAWTEKITSYAHTAIPAGAQLSELTVRCSETFCRVKMVKPIDSSVDWPEIDSALVPVATGEAIFSTENEGGVSTGYLYFAESDNKLPLGNVDAEGDGV
ncbi:MAG: hypothetical protein RL385_3062 [Pseudomonadota bacterium]|jgi:hypothetical protein